MNASNHLKTKNPTSSSLSSSSSCVQSSSVQLQFTSLTNDKDRFRQEKEIAENDRAEIQSRIQKLKAEQIGLMTKIRKGQEELGNTTQKDCMLQQEKLRLERILENERKALESCILHAKNLEKKHQELTKLYCTEVGALNDEVAGLLHLQRSSKLMDFVSCDSLKEVFVKNAREFPSNTDNETFRLELCRMQQETDQLQQEIIVYRNTLKAYDRFLASNTSISNRIDKVDLAGSHEASISNQMELFYGSDVINVEPDLTRT